MIKKLKIGQEVFGLSYVSSAWNSCVNFVGRVVSFDENCVVVVTWDDIHAQHSGSQFRLDGQTTVFIDRHDKDGRFFIFDTARQRIIKKNKILNGE